LVSKKLNSFAVIGFFLILFISRRWNVFGRRFAGRRRCGRGRARAHVIPRGPLAQIETAGPALFALEDCLHLIARQRDLAAETVDFDRIPFLAVRLKGNTIKIYGLGGEVAFPSSRYDCVVMRRPFFSTTVYCAKASAGKS